MSLLLAWLFHTFHIFLQSDKCTTGTVVDNDEGDMISVTSLTNLMHNIKCLATLYVHYPYLSTDYCFFCVLMQSVSCISNSVVIDLSTSENDKSDMVSE